MSRKGQTDHRGVLKLNRKASEHYSTESRPMTASPREDNFMTVWTCCYCREGPAVLACSSVCVCCGHVLDLMCVKETPQPLPYRSWASEFQSCNTTIRFPSDPQPANSKLVGPWTTSHRKRTASQTFSPRCTITIPYCALNLDIIERFFSDIFAERSWTIQVRSILLHRHRPPADNYETA